MGRAHFSFSLPKSYVFVKQALPNFDEFLCFFYLWGDSFSNSSNSFRVQLTLSSKETLVWGARRAHPLSQFMASYKEMFVFHFRGPVGILSREWPQGPIFFLFVFVLFEKHSRNHDARSTK